jgi:hypothetical protein
MALTPAPALAATATFTAPGCSTWPVPSGVASVNISAVGSVGVGGTGDLVSGTLSGLASGQTLDLCVNYGGGGTGTGGGAGGGASGVALGNDFSTPVLIAAGGGGAGYGGGPLTQGGSAGSPSGGTGGSNGGGGGGGGGGNNTTMMGGSRGADVPCPFGVTCVASTAGAVFSAAGPGTGGTGGNGGNGGGGGGGGYYGGGGGGGTGPGGNQAGGGGGGSDFCATSLSAPTALSGCGVTGTNTSFGAASVTLAYTAVPAAPCIVPALKGKTFKKAKKALQKAKCHTGNVKRIGHKPRRVVTESPKAGTTLAGGSPIELKVKGAT